MAKGKKSKKNQDPTWKPRSKKYRTGRKVNMSDNHPFKLWGKAVAEAKKELKIEKSFGVKKGTAVYKRAKAIHEKLKKQAAKKK